MTDWKNRIVETAEMAVKDLKANPKNWRKHPKAQADALAGVLDTVGWVQQVIWNRQTGHLVDGHLRVELAAKRKEKTIPVNVVDLSPEEEAMILATFDPIAAMAEADRQMLQGLMESIETEDEQVRALLESIAREEKIDLGGEPAEAPEPQVDRAAELQEQWQTARGQLWQCGDHRVLCGDSTNADDVARLMGGDTADMVFTDPPYGVSYADKNAFLNAVGRGNHIQKPIENDHMTVADMKALWVSAFTVALGNARPGCPYYVCSPQGGELMMMMMMSLLEAGWELKHCLIWVKNNHVLGRSDYNYKHEPILYGWKEGGHKFYGGGGAVSVWEVDKPHKSDLHPTMKPVELVTTALANSTLPAEIVFDPFGGSGTTLIACEQLGRRCFGMEISPAYVAVILQRWHDMTGRDPVLLET